MPEPQGAHRHLPKCSSIWTDPQPWSTTTAAYGLFSNPHSFKLKKNYFCLFKYFIFNITSLQRIVRTGQRISLYYKVFPIPCPNSLNFALFALINPCHHKFSFFKLYHFENKLNIWRPLYFQCTLAFERVCKIGLNYRGKSFSTKIFFHSQYSKETSPCFGKQE